MKDSSSVKKDKKKVLRKAFKAEVELNEEALQAILRLSRVLIHLWNMALEHCQNLLERKKDKEQDVPAISDWTLNYWLNKMKATSVTLSDGVIVPLKSVGTDVMREVLRKHAGSWKSYFESRKNNDERVRPPMPKKEDWFQTMSWSSFSMKDGNLIVFTANKTRVCIPLSEYLRKMIAGKTVKYVTLSRRRDGKFELSLVCTISDLPAVPEHPTFVRAIDLGAGNVVVTDSDGSEFLIPTRRPDKFWKQSIKKVEGRIERSKKGSRSHIRRTHARRVMFARSLHQHKDHQRKLAHALVDTSKVQCIVIGKGINRMGLARSKTSTNDQHWGVQNTGYLFRQLKFIEEKAAERGVLLIKLKDPRREGRLDDPEAKFEATRTLLEEGAKRFGLKMPTVFRRKGFYFEC